LASGTLVRSILDVVSLLDIGISGSAVLIIRNTVAIRIDHSA